MHVSSLASWSFATLLLVFSVDAINQQQWEAISGGKSLTDKSAKDICHMTQATPEDTWNQSGASSFL